MNSRSLIIILLTLGILVGISGCLVMGGSLAQGIASLKDGRAVSCTVNVNAPLFGGNLEIKDVPVCQPQGSCFVSPAKSFSIASVSGDIGLWQSGKLYATEEVEQSRLSSAQVYTIKACIPQEASAVRIGIIT